MYEEQPLPRRRRPLLRFLLQALQFIMPNFVEEIWQRAGGAGSVQTAEPPENAPAKIVGQKQRIQVRINGRPQAEIAAVRDVDVPTLTEVAREAVASRLLGKVIDRVDIIPGEVVNFVLME